MYPGLFGQKLTRCDFGQSEILLRGVLTCTQSVPDFVPDVTRYIFVWPLLF